MARVLLIADTHVDRHGATQLIGQLAQPLAEADVIVHAGDVIDSPLLDALADVAPVHAVKGNNDRHLDRPERLAITIDGVEVAVVHDSGPAMGRAQRLRRWFPTADVVVFGHSHLPWHETDELDGHVQHHVNPGSPTQRRRAPTRTVAWLEVDGGEVVSIEHVDLAEVRATT